MIERARPGDAASPRPAPAKPSLFRRLLAAPDVHGGADPLSAGRPGLESELAERLDSVLGIAERLAASHDRHELFRTIVDETKRALRVDHVTIRVLRDDRLVVAAWAGLPDERRAALPVFGVHEGWVGEVLRTGRVAAWTDVQRRSALRHRAV